LKLLADDPYNPILSTHKLKGKLSGAWACLVEYDCRIAFSFEQNQQTLEEEINPEWGEGIYLLPDPLKTGVVVIHQLPETSETLWLRLIGRGRKRDEAIAQLESLPADNPLRSDTLELLYNVSRNLEATAKTSQEDREFIMRLAPLYQLEKEQTLQEGRQEGRREEAANLVNKLLQRRFGETPQNIEETIRGLSLEGLEDLAVALLDFEGMTALVSWLEERASTEL
jgi:hypothetical protein